MALIEAPFGGPAAPKTASAARVAMMPRRASRARSTHRLSVAIASQYRIFAAKRGKLCMVDKPRLKWRQVVSSRINPYTAAHEQMKAVYAFNNATKQNSLEPKLVELVKTRASQLNHCAFCLEMHTREAREIGETEARLYLLTAWRESSLYTPRERAALAWTEALTNLSETGAPDADYELAHSVFSDEELVELTLVIVMINVWTIFGVGFRREHAVPKEAEPLAASR
jgi:AhpD family alkylhydroperoxidase